MEFPIDPIASGLYVLSYPRQAKSMKFLVSIYDVDPTPGTYTAASGDKAGNIILLYENVPCSVQPKKEYDQPIGFGLEQVNNQDVLDNLYFHLNQPTQAGQWMVITSQPAGSTAMVALWWSFQGNNLPIGWRAFTQMIEGKRMARPKASDFAPGQAPSAEFLN